MAASQAKRQKQMARKAAQASARAKVRRASASRRAAVPMGFPESACTWPIHEAWISESVRSLHQGTAVLARKSGASVAAAFYLVDVGCMGVKSAFGRRMDAYRYSAYLDSFCEHEKLVRAEAACVRKLVEGAVAYAADLGFSPDPDYHSAKALFGDVNASGCTTEFEFGEDGKPLYVSRPDDSPARIRSVMEKLTRRCGPKGFHYIIAATPDDFADLVGL